MGKLPCVGKRQKVVRNLGRRRIRSANQNCVFPSSKSLCFQEAAAMATALNLTAPLKQDAATKAKLQALQQNFAAIVQPAIDQALRESKVVHFARVVVIEDKYIQVLTEFDGDSETYTEFFRVKLPGVFKAIFELVEGAPSWDELNDRETFFKFARAVHIRALGGDPTNTQNGYLFSAYGDKKVAEILPKLS
jgi:hypothetical protein